MYCCHYTCDNKDSLSKGLRKCKTFSTLPGIKLWWGNTVFKYNYLPVKYHHVSIFKLQVVEIPRENTEGMTS